VKKAKKICCSIIGMRLRISCRGNRSQSAQRGRYLAMGYCFGIIIEDLVRNIELMMWFLKNIDTCSLDYKRIRNGEHQTLETLINEEALLFAKYLGARSIREIESRRNFVGESLGLGLGP
jgi:hypothetical protein